MMDDGGSRTELMFQKMMQGGRISDFSGMKEVKKSPRLFKNCNNTSLYSNKNEIARINAYVFRHLLIIKTI